MWECAMAKVSTKYINTPRGSVDHIKWLASERKRRNNAKQAEAVTRPNRHCVRRLISFISLWFVLNALKYLIISQIKSSNYIVCIGETSGDNDRLRCCHFIRFPLSPYLFLSITEADEITETHSMYVLTVLLTVSVCVGYRLHFKPFQ